MYKQYLNIPQTELNYDDRNKMNYQLEYKTTQKVNVV